MKLHLVVFAALVFAGCTPKTNTTRAELDTMGQGEGVLVLSITENKTDDLGCGEGFVYINGTSSHTLGATWDSGYSPSFKKVGRHEIARLVVLKLPVGNYEANDWLAGTYNEPRRPKTEKSIPFTIHKATTTYIGNFEFNCVRKTNAFGLKILRSAHIEVKDKNARDMKAAKTAYPNLPISVASENAIPSLVWR